jgi:hypothetical protein
MIYCTRGEHINDYTTYEPMIYCGGVIVSVLTSSAVDHAFIGGVMVSVLASSAIDHGFIGDVIVSVLASSAVDHGFIGGVTPPMNP